MRFQLFTNFLTNDTDGPMTTARVQFICVGGVRLARAMEELLPVKLEVVVQRDCFEFQA